MADFGTLDITNRAAASESLVFSVVGSSYDSNNNANIATQEAFPNGIHFNTDGTKMFIAGSSGDDFNEFALSTAYDPSTFTFTQNASQDAGANSDAVVAGLSFSPDGTKMYMTGNATNRIYEYDLSTGFDISTRSLNQYVSLTGNAGVWQHEWKPDGTSFFVIDYSAAHIEQWDLTTAWDVSTASLAHTFDTSGEITRQRGITFNNDGTLMYVGDDANADITVWKLSTGYDLNSTITKEYTYSDSSAFSSLGDLFWKPDGTILFVTDDGSGLVKEIHCPNPFILQDPMDNTTNVSISTQTTTGQFGYYDDTDDQLIVLEDQDSSSGVFRYVLKIYEGMTYANDNKLVGTQTTNPRGLMFSPDGLKMFVGASTTVYEYALTAPFDVSTATYTDSYTDSTNWTDAGGLCFNDDGTKMFRADNGGGSASDITEHSLSTAYDVSTATYTTKYDVSGKEQSACDVRMTADGTRMFVLGFQTDDVHEYVLGTAFDLSGTVTHFGNVALTSIAQSLGFAISEKNQFFVLINDPSNNVVFYDRT